MPVHTHKIRGWQIEVHAERGGLVHGWVEQPGMSKFIQFVANDKGTITYSNRDIVPKYVRDATKRFIQKVRKL